MNTHNLQFDQKIQVCKKKGMGNLQYGLGIKSRPGSQIFPTLECKLRNILHSQQAMYIWIRMK